MAQGEAIVVLTRNSGFSNQILVGREEMPWDIMKDAYGAHYSATSLCGGPAGWLVTMTQGAPRLAELADKATSFKSLVQLLRAAQHHNLVITNVDYNGVEWVATFATPAWKQTQTFLPEEDFPRENIDKSIATGWYVTEITHGEDRWLVVLSTATGYTGQRVLTGEVFPQADVDKAISQGYAVTEVTYGDDQYVVVLSKGTGWGEQQILRTDSFPTEKVQSAWLEGYHVTSTFWRPEKALSVAIKNVEIEGKLGDIAADSSIHWFENFVEMNAGTELGFIAVQRLAGRFLRTQDWQAAAEVYERYRALFPTMTKRFDEIGKILLAEDDGSRRIDNLGETVNTEAGEFMPLPSADDSRLFFTGMRRADGVGGEDIYVSIRGDDGRWGRAERVVGGVNTANHEFGTSISADNNRIVLFSARDGGVGRGDLYHAERGRSGWGEPQSFPAPINTIHWDCDGFLTSDGQAMIFASDRPFGNGRYQKKDVPLLGERWGNTDLYVAVRTDSGWSQPINLGAVVNTGRSERSPFLHPDGKTLYFSSSGHAGLGELDIFVSTRLNENSWTEWSEPVNLGTLVNGPGSDWGYRVSTGGQTAYFASEEMSGGRGRSDVYRITTGNRERPAPVVTVRGKIRDADGNPVEAKVKWEDLATGTVVGELRSDPETGEYFIALPLGRQYGYYAERDGYHPVSKNVDLTEQTMSFDLRDDITLVPIDQIAEGGLAVRINNIFFDYDRANLRSESQAELDRLLKLFNRYPDALIEIAGHTDSIASDQYNASLSERRAQAVVDYLISVGYPATNLVARGYGEARPIDDNGTDEGRQFNRRVEFRFLRTGTTGKDLSGAR